MTIIEIIPIVESLTHADKFELMQFLLAQLAKEEGIPLQTQVSKKGDSLWGIVGMAEGEIDLPHTVAHSGNHKTIP